MTVVAHGLILYCTNEEEQQIFLHTLYFYFAIM